MRSLILPFALSFSAFSAASQPAASINASTATQNRRINFSPTIFYNTYNAKALAVLKIRPGDTVYTESLDALGYDKDSIRKGKRGNPLTGPFFIDDAMPGDAIAVTIVGLGLNRNYATTLEALVPKVLPKHLAKKTW